MAPTILKIIEEFGDNLYEVTNLIATAIDFEETKQQNRLTIKPGINTTLDEFRYSAHFDSN